MRDATIWRPPPWPREHGAWVMLFVPLLLGLAASETLALAPLLVWPAVVLGFLSRYAALPIAVRIVEGKPIPAQAMRRRAVWAALYFTASALCLAGAWVAAPGKAGPSVVGAALVVGLLGAGHSALALRGWDRTLPGELVGMIGLASSASLVMVCAGLPLGPRAAGVGVLALTYSVSSLAYVRSYRVSEEAQPFALPICVAIHVCLLTVLIGFAGNGWLPYAALAAFIPIAVRTTWGFVAPPASLVKLGHREIAVAIAFVALACFGLLNPKLLV